MESVEEKCIKMTDLLTKRETERKLDVQKRRENKEQNLAQHERIDYFEKTFTEKHSEIKKALNESCNKHSTELANHFDNVSKSILLLQKYVASSNIFLRGYDIKKCQQSLQDLTYELKELEEKLLPKKKFGFKSKSKVNKTNHDIKANGRGGKDEIDFVQRITLNEKFVGFDNNTCETLVLQQFEVFGKDVTLKNLEKCIVKLFGSPSTLHISNVKNSVILCGPVSTSIFVESCENCKFVLACQQLRLHSSNNLDIYLHVTSRAIMEDCKKIFIAPYNFIYKEIQEDFNIASLDLNVNNWCCIDDFNWLNIEKRSPNWSILDEYERINNWEDYCLNLNITL